MAAALDAGPPRHAGHLGAGDDGRRHRQSAADAVRSAACRASHHRAGRPTGSATSPPRSSWRGCLAGQPAAKALQSTTAAVFEILARTAKRGGRRTAARDRRAEPVASDGDGAAAPPDASRQGPARLSDGSAGRTVAGRRRLQGGLDRGGSAARRRPRRRRLSQLCRSGRQPSRRRDHCRRHADRPA